MSILLQGLILVGGLTIGTAATSFFHVFKQFGVLPKSYRELEHKEINYHESGEFISPEKVVYYPEKTTGNSSGLVRFLKVSEYAPKNPLPKVILNRDSFSAEPENFAVYWLGHSSTILELDGKRIVIDPVFDNAAFLPGIVRRYDESPLKRDELPKLDIVLITHDHYVHLEYATIRHLRDREGIKFVVPFGVGQRLKGWGVPENSIQELMWDETAKIKGLEITAMKGVHYSGRSWFDRNQTLWASYGLKSKDKNIFWSGDTGYSEHFKEIGEKYGPFDLAGIEIDGWNDGWPNTHLYPEEVIKAAKDIGAEMILPVHWAVFDLALHPWDESIGILLSEAEKEGVPIVTPMMGEKIIPGISEIGEWWKNK